MTRSRTLARLSTLIVIAFVDMVGLLMIIPLLPFYALKFKAGNVGAGIGVAVLMSSFTAAQLISAPIWGRVSDRYGRRPALLAGLTASALAYLVFAYADSLWLLLLSRLVQGAGGGTTGVIQAYVADTAEPDERAKALGWISAATNVGVTLGPPLGAVALKIAGFHGPGLIASALCVVNIAFAWRFLHESRDLKEANRIPRQRGASFRALFGVLAHPKRPAPRLVWIYALAIGAFQGLTAIIALYLAVRFGVTAQGIWPLFTFMGVISVGTRAGLLGRAVDRWGEVKLSRAGLVMLGSGLLLFPWMPNLIVLAPVVALLPLGTAFTFPCVTSLLSRVISSNERGLYMGVQQTFGGIMRVIVPLWAGFAFDHLGYSIPFYTSALLVAVVLALAVNIPNPRKQQPELAHAA